MAGSVSAPVVYQSADGKLFETDKPMGAAMAKLAGDQRVILLHHHASQAVYFDPYDEYMKTRGEEPRYSECAVIDLKTYQKLARLYGGEVMGPGWFPRHVSHQTRTSKGLLDSMGRCAEAIDDLLGVLNDYLHHDV